MKKTCIISDLHLGAANAPKSIENLKRFLNNIDCDQLVLLGDFLDRWALSIDTKPKKYKDLVAIDNNSSQIVEALHNCHKRGIKIFVMNGNHDFDLTQSDLDEICDKKNVFNLTTPEKFTNNNPELYLEHGNSFDLFNANGESDDGHIKFPLGYFKTRLNHSYKTLPMHHDYFVSIAKEEIIADLHRHNKFDNNMNKKAFDGLLNEYSSMLLHALRKDVSKGFSGLSGDEINIQMPEGHSLNLETDILPNYKKFVKRFYYDHLLEALYPSTKHDCSVIEWEALMYAIDPVRTFGLEYYAKKIKNNSKMAKIKSVIFGHTHMAQISKEDKYSFILANSGCWCSNPLGPNTTSIECKNLSISMICDTENASIQ